MNISFKASLLTNTVIKKKVGFFYVPTSANIVLMNPSDSSDLVSMQKAASDWRKLNNGNTYFDDILNGFSQETDIFALTTQNNGFENMKSENILGVAMLSKDKEHRLFKDEHVNELDYLQVKPSEKYHSNYRRQFKGIGSALIDYIKKITGDVALVLDADSNAKGFYKKLMFRIKDDFNPEILYWESLNKYMSHFVKK